MLNKTLITKSTMYPNRVVFTNNKELRPELFKERNPGELIDYLIDNDLFDLFSIVLHANDKNFKFLQGDFAMTKANKSFFAGFNNHDFGDVEICKADDADEGTKAFYKKMKGKKFRAALYSFVSPEDGNTRFSILLPTNFDGDDFLGPEIDELILYELADLFLEITGINTLHKLGKYINHIADVSDGVSLV